MRFGSHLLEIALSVLALIHTSPPSAANNVSEFKNLQDLYWLP